MRSDSTYDTSVLDNIPRQVYNILDDVGAPCHLSGYDMVAYALSLALEDVSCLSNLSKNLYPKLGNVFNKPTANIERCISNLIEYTFLNGDACVLNSYFGNQIQSGKSKVTNVQFLFILYRVLKGIKVVN